MPVHLALGVLDQDLFRRGAKNRAINAGQKDLSAVPRDSRLHACADNRHVRPHERDRLALHVGTHQRPVGVVVLQEGDEGC